MWSVEGVYKIIWEKFEFFSFDFFREFRTARGTRDKHPQNLAQFIDLVARVEYYQVSSEFIIFVQYFYFRCGRLYLNRDISMV